MESNIIDFWGFKETSLRLSPEEYGEMIAILNDNKNFMQDVLARIRGDK